MKVSPEASQQPETNTRCKAPPCQRCLGHPASDIRIRVDTLNRWDRRRRDRYKRWMTRLCSQCAREWYAAVASLLGTFLIEGDQKE